jgi:predicted phosphodiesterase
MVTSETSADDDAAHPDRPAIASVAARVAAHHRTRRLARVAAVVVLGLVGGGVGLAMAGTTHNEIGPLNTTMRVAPTWHGGTVVDIPPLGQLDLDTHSGPLGLHATLTGVDVDEARSLVDNPAQIPRLKPRLEADLRWAVKMAVLRSLLAAVAGAALLGAIGTRRVRSAIGSAGVAATAMVAAFGVAAATWNPAALTEPRYTGLLTSAPTVVGDAEGLVSHFSVYGDQLARIVGNVSALYTTTSHLPVLPDGHLVRVLHISDLHLAPQSWGVIRTVAKQYDVDVIVDSGDITDHGTKAENRYVDEIRHLPVPYVWVRGNHDSMVTQAAMRRLRNVTVLDGKPRTVAGLRFLGAGDPTFTPDKSTTPDEEQVVAGAEALAKKAQADGGNDVVVYHDPVADKLFDGNASMVLSGHLHYRKVTRGAAGTWLMQQGSTGGSGLRALEPKQPAPIEMSVLYVDASTGQLQGYDDIKLGGLGLASAQITRQVVNDPTGAQAAPPPGQRAHHR